MRIVRWLAGALLSLAALPAANALPAASPQTAGQVTQVQADCIGPRCLTVGPIRRPYLRGTRPPELPDRELFRRAPQRPQIKLQQPEMDYRVPRFERNRPLVRPIRPPDPTFRAVGVPQKHIDWCYARYRSYRETDNSYQPFSGPRKQCKSPFG